MDKRGKKQEIEQGKEQRIRRSPVAAVCSALGTILLIVLVLACLPLVLPRAFGFQIYTVVSGSMEPAIPVGSLVYIQEGVQPEDVEEDSVIAFYGGKESAAIITHRVVENRVLMGEFITKGDANPAQDINPVPYDDFIGKVRLSVPMAGKAAQILTSTQGKIAAACVILLAVLLQVAGGRPPKD